MQRLRARVAARGRGFDMWDDRYVEVEILWWRKSCGACVKCSLRVMSAEQSIARAYPDIVYSTIESLLDYHVLMSAASVPFKTALQSSLYRKERWDGHQASVALLGADSGYERPTILTLGFCYTTLQCSSVPDGIYGDHNAPIASFHF